MWRLFKQHAQLACSAPAWFIFNPLVWLSYQFNVLILIWGLELLRFVHITLLPTPQPKVMVMKMEYEEPIVKDIVLIGAGHAHVHVLKMFGMQPEPNVRITLITEWIDTPYSGMLPGYVSGVYTRDECHIDVLRLAEFAKARVVIGRAQQVWMDSKTVVIEGHAPIHFDFLSINIGSSPTLPKENSQLVIPVKPISHMVQQVERILARDDGGEKLRVAVVGGGAGGVEVALAMYHRLRNANMLHELVLISKSQTLCPSHSVQFQRLVEENIRCGTDIKLMLGCEAVGVNSSGGVEEKRVVIRFANDAREEFDKVIWCTHARGAEWLSSAFPVDELGFVKVNTKLQVNAQVFAAGDCACFESSPLPKSGVFAVRQGPILAANLRLACQGNSKLKDYIPQRTFLGILGTENGKLAMGSKGEMGVAPCEWMWDLKEWIDRKWLSGYNELLPIRRFPTELGREASKVALALSEDEQDELCRIGMKCGGCGSKVSSSLLAKSLSQLQVVKRKEVVCGLEAPDDCSLIQLGGNSKATAATSIDFFRSIWRDEYVFGQIAVNHALSDVWAMGCDPVSALCMAQLPVSPQKKLQQRLQILMQGAVHQLNQANCALTGGHTTEGAELMMGFSVLGENTNNNNEEDVMRKANVNLVQAGDVIILTKPIGTGTIMEAHMRLEASGLWVKAALDSMLLPNRLAAQVFSRFGATAMTDVTGFGLGGHLLEMMKPLAAANAELMAHIELGSVPLLPGAVDCLEMQEYISTLALRNERSGLKRMRHSFSNEEDLLVVSLLFDPQTSGGLLAFVPREKSVECLHELKANGYLDAMRIGQVVSKQPGHKQALLVELV